MFCTMPRTCRETGWCSSGSQLAFGISGSDYRHVDFPEHLSSFASVQQGNVLRRGYNDSTWEHGGKEISLSIHPSSLEIPVGVFLNLVKFCIKKRKK